MLFCHLKYRRDDIPIHIIYIYTYMHTQIYTHVHTYVSTHILTHTWAFPAGSVVKNLPAKAGDTGDAGSIPGLGGSPGGGNGIHSSILAWEISWTEESGRLQFMRL